MIRSNANLAQSTRTLQATSAARDSLASRRPGIQAHVYRYVAKRTVDVTLVLLTAPMVVIFVGMLVLCLTVNGGNPFYAQDRVGRGGRVFRMWKFRTMVVGAESKLEAHLAANPAARDEWNLNQKLKCDPRITRLGRALRCTSLDELPQLWNVLTGDMSLVGPRPMMPSQQELYRGDAYYRLRPGMTGSWQVSKRNGSSFAERAGFDEDYDRKLSLTTDVGILLQTVRVVVRATGY